MNEFKFKLGELVKHRTASAHNDRMLILARMFEESKNGVDEKYLVSYLNMGQPVRQLLNVAELASIE